MKFVHSGTLMAQILKKTKLSLFFLTELDHEEISRCINWMAPFAQAIQVSGYPAPKSTNPGTKYDEISNYQCHTVDIKLLELAHRHIELQNQQDEDQMNDSGDFQDMVY